MTEISEKSEKILRIPIFFSDFPRSKIRAIKFLYLSVLLQLRGFTVMETAKPRFMYDTSVGIIPNLIHIPK